MPDPAQVPVQSKAHNGITADQEATVAAAAGLRLLGWAARESAGSAAVATFRIMRGATVAAGAVLVPVELAADNSKSDWYGPQGIAADGGLTIDHIAGTVDVTLFYADVDPSV